ncbi:hypothetical protein MCEMRE196_01052 [Candidatus Nanopelagicaceae bacterium]
MAANQESAKSAPKVSKLPLPISDSPLVIDLPDGQKIVVGKMTQGSVIEVATWRGVGRPDSRTSRLMLGMGSGNVNEDSDEESSQNPGPARPPVSKKPQGFAGVIFSIEQFIKNFNKINWSATAKALIQSLTSKKPKKSKKSKKNADSVQAPSVDDQSTSAPAITPAITVSPVSEDSEIEAWLNSITEKAARNSSKSKPAAKKAPAKKAAVTKKAAPKSTNKRK